MAISFVAGAFASATTVTLSGLGIQEDDLIVYDAYRSSSNTAPSLPSGKISIGSAGANTNSESTRYAFATGSGDTSGTHTNADRLGATLYRGVRGFGASASGGAASATVNYPALSLVDTSGHSWVHAAAGHRTASNVDTAPAGMTLSGSIGSGPELATFYTAGGVTSWSSTNVSVNANSGWRSAVAELLDHSTWNPFRKPSNIALSSGQMLATATSTTDYSVFASFPRNSGLYAFEMVTNAAHDGRWGVGNESAATAFTSIGDDANSIGIGDSGDVTRNNSVVFSTGFTFAAGVAHRVQVVVNVTTQKIWFRIATVASGVFGNWNGSGAANPATGVGGVSTGLSGKLTPGWGSIANGATCGYLGTPGISGIPDWDYLPSGGYTLAAASGGFGLAGQAAVPRAARILSAAAGTYVEIGQAAGLRHGLRLSASAAAYGLAGQAAAPRASRVLASTSASYTVSGQAASLVYGHGAATYSLTAAAAAYALAGQPASLRQGRKFAALAASFSFSGRAAALSRGRGFAAGAGAHAFSGASVGFRRSYVMPAGPGAFDFSGLGVDFAWSGVGKWLAETPVLSGWTAQPSVGGAWAPDVGTGAGWTRETSAGADWTAEPQPSSPWSRQ